MNTDRFQGRCFVNGEGYNFMDVYDGMPRWLRNRLAYSPFNLCSFCVELYSNTRNADEVITAMENFIRREERT
jgi:hypothetical protein